MVPISLGVKAVKRKLRKTQQGSDTKCQNAVACFRFVNTVEGVPWGIMIYNVKRDLVFVVMEQYKSFLEYELGNGKAKCIFLKKKKE